MGDLLLGLVDFRGDEFEAFGGLVVVVEALADGGDAVADGGGEAAFGQAGGFVAFLGGGELLFGGVEFGFDGFAAGGTEEFFEAGALVEEFEEQPEHAVERLAAEIIDARGAFLGGHVAAEIDEFRCSAGAGFRSAAASVGLRKAISCWKRWRGSTGRGGGVLVLSLEHVLETRIEAEKPEVAEFGGGEERQPRAMARR